MMLKQSPARLNLVLGVSVVLACEAFSYIPSQPHLVKFCVRCTPPNSLAAPTLLTLVITDGKRSFEMLGLRKTSSTVFSRLTLILFSLAQSMTWAISRSMDVAPCRRPQSHSVQNVYCFFIPLNLKMTCLIAAVMLTAAVKNHA